MYPSEKDQWARIDLSSCTSTLKITRFAFLKVQLFHKMIVRHIIEKDHLLM